MTTPSKKTGGLPLLTPTHLARSHVVGVPGTPSAAQHHAASLQETFTVLGELTHEFKNHADEVALIARLLAKRTEIAAAVSQQRGAMRALVTSLTQQVSDLAATTATPPALGVQQQQTILHHQKAAITKQIDAITAEIARLEAAGVQMTEAKAALVQQKAECEAANAKQMPAMAGTMGLYRNFSSIAWDYDADEETTVKGTFHFDRTAALKNFNFDRRQVSDFDIANQLWEIMDAAH